MRMRELKSQPLVVTQVDEALGVVDAIVSVMGVRDAYDDIIVNGAYSKTITERARKVRVLDHHNATSVLDVIGRPLAMREIGRDELPAELLARFPSATGALWTSTQYALETDRGRTAFNLIAGGYVDEYSIGYEAIQSEYRRDGDDVVRLLKEIRLWEYSPVVWGANPATATVGVKGDEGAMRLLGLVTADKRAASDPMVRSAALGLWQALTIAGMEMVTNSAGRAEAHEQLVGDRAAEPGAQDATPLTGKREELLERLRKQLEEM